MSTKIIPVFAGPLTANGLKQWLGACEDGFENYQDTHDNKKLGVKTRIRMTGVSLTEPQMAEWWSAGRKEYLELALWETFVDKLKDRFLPTDWKTDALFAFYRCTQGKRDFRTFAAELAAALNALPSGMISTSVHKYHLLFGCNDHLYYRIRAVAGFSLEDTTQTPDKLTAFLAAQWDSLVIDVSSRTPGRSPLAVTPSPSVSLAFTSTSTPSTSPKYVPLSETEKADLTAAHGCWNCRGKPGDPDWISHQRLTCPGNPTFGARPGRDFVARPPCAPVAVVFAEPRLSVGEPSAQLDDDSDEDYNEEIDDDEDF